MGSFGKYSFFVVSRLRHCVGSDVAIEGDRVASVKQRSDEGEWEKRDGGKGKKRQSDGAT